MSGSEVFEQFLINNKLMIMSTNVTCFLIRNVLSLPPFFLCFLPSMEMSHDSIKGVVKSSKHAHIVDSGSFTNKTLEMLMDSYRRTGMLDHSVSLCGRTEMSMRSWKQPVSSSGP